MGIKKFNKVVAAYNYELDDNYTFISLEDLFASVPENSAFRILGFYTSSAGKYGEAPVAVIKNYLVNLPKHLLEQVKEIMADDETTELINAGKCAFEIRTYYSKAFDVDCYSVNFLDLNDESDMKDKRLIILPCRSEIDSYIIEQAEKAEGKAPAKKAPAKKAPAKKAPTNTKPPERGAQQFMEITEEELDRFPFA